MKMKHNCHTACMGLMLLLCLAAGRGLARNVADKNVCADTITAFRFPAIPSTLTTPEARAAYLVEHYWDCTNWADSNYVHHPEVTEQAWVDYIDLMRLVPAQTADRSLKALFGQAEKERKCYLYLRELAEKYLYDVGSPLRNEERYIVVLDALLASDMLSETEKIRPQAQRELALRNRPGTVAVDFTYTLASGKDGRLHGIRSDYVLLFVNDPGCHTCLETLDRLKHSSAVSRAIADKRLAVLSFYPDEAVDEWRQWLPDFPSTWINAYDRTLTIRERNLYDLRSLPVLYLLDSQKKVLLKNATVEEVEAVLEGQRKR